MQEFFINNGLYLLIALLVVIAVMFILSRGKTKTEEPAEPIATVTPVEVPATSLEATPAPVDPLPTPVVAAPEPPAAAPVAPPPIESIPVSPAVTAADSGADDLLKLKGVGAKLNALLIDLGVTRYQQIADWTEADIAAIDARLGNFKGRPVRDQWIDQAKLLAAGDIAGFEARYGKI